MAGTGTPPAHNRLASSGHEADSYEDFDVTAHKGRLQVGENVLAFQVHNVTLDSSDLTLRAELVDREILGDPTTVIRNVDALQQLTHLRGVYSRRQLQTVLAEFWENHFTTDFDKVEEYFDDELLNSDATDAMSGSQARQEAAQVDYVEYEFFYDNALGNFGDMLLYSATAPSMLIYLDSVRNLKSEPNENYSREILELSALGVASASDPRYTQRDIEELAKCFTGWTICKIEPGAEQPFPLSSTSPPTDCGVDLDDRAIVDLGLGWKYLKGTQEPTPAVGGEPTLDWAQLSFNDTGWTSGGTGLGYGDGDDRTVLNDMSGNYVSVYLRRRFNVSDPDAIDNLILEVSYDDGFIAYLNGQEIARSESMEDGASPPAYTFTADLHEVDEGADYFNLERYRHLLNAGTNVLAIQVHNASLGSSDLSILPRLIDRTILGGIENGDPAGSWSFRFDPEEHDTSRKVIFAGTPQEIVIPSGRTGTAGLRDGLDVVEDLINHPRTAEFICIKLIQRFVSDEMSLAVYSSDRTSIPIELRTLLADAIAAWNSTSPRGNIETVMRAILKPSTKDGAFWDPDYMRAKVKTPVEFINSALRALDASVTGDDLPNFSDDMGMHLFTRDDPDGWPETGQDWMDTGTMLSRINFVRELSGNDDDDNDFLWNARTYMDSRGLSTATAIVDHINEHFFDETLTSSMQSQLIQFLTTDVNGNPLTFSRARADFVPRVEALMGLVLSSPLFHIQ